MLVQGDTEQRRESAVRVRVVVASCCVLLLLSCLFKPKRNSEESAVRVGSTSQRHCSVEELADKNDGTINGEISCSHAHHLYILNHERHSSTKASDITACDAA